MSIYYLLIGDKQTNKQIGEYFEIAQGASIQEFNAVRTKGLNLLSSITEKSTQSTSSDMQNFNIYYILYPSNTFYFVAVLKKFQDVIVSSLIFEMIDDIERQGIKLQVDKNVEGQLNSVGLQNLKITIDKYLTPKNVETVTSYRVDSERNIVTQTGDEDVVKPGEGSMNKKDKSNTSGGLTKEEMVETVNSNNKSMNLSLDLTSHPYQTTYNSVLKKTRYARFIILVIGIICGCFSMYAIVNE